MKRNEIRSRAVEQALTVSRLFAKHGIDLDLVGAGVTLLNSLIQAKRRTKERGDYIAKGIQFNLNKTDRFALLEVIQGDKEFWQAWVKQHEIFEETGLDDDRPTLHRLNPDGHYEFGNIGMLSSGDHLQENAVPMMIIDTDDSTIRSYPSVTKMAEAEGIKQSKVDALRASKKKARA